MTGPTLRNVESRRGTGMGALMQPPSKLFNHNFILLWLGQGVSQIGNTAFGIAMMFWVLHTTGSAAIMGFVVMASSIPGVLLSPIGGVVADRFSRRTIIVVSDLISGVAVLALAALLHYKADDNELVLTGLFLVAILGGVVASFFRPAINACIPDIVPPNQLPKANSLMAFSFRVATLVGLVFGGAVYSQYGAFSLFVFNGISFLVSGLSECFITIPQKLAEREKRSVETMLTGFKVDVIEGFRYIWSRPGMRNLMLAAGFWNFFMEPYRVLLPVYVSKTLAVDDMWYGLLIGAFMVGSMIGLAVYSGLDLKGRRRMYVMMFFPMATAVLTSLYGLVLVPWIVLGLFFLVGFNSVMFDMTALVVLQTNTPSEVRGRVFSVMGALLTGLTPISMGLSGVVADLVNQNIPIIFVACAAIILCITIRVAASRAYRAFISYDPPPEQAVHGEDPPESPPVDGKGSATHGIQTS